MKDRLVVRLDLLLHSCHHDGGQRLDVLGELGQLVLDKVHQLLLTNTQSHAGRHLVATEETGSRALYIYILALSRLSFS